MPFLQHADTDLFLATRFYSLLDASEAASQSSIKGVTVIPLGAVPKKIFHRTSQKGLAGILQGGMIPGSSRSDRSHNYLSEDADYMSGMRSTQPIEVTIDPAKAMQAGCEFFVTETDRGSPHSRYHSAERSHRRRRHHQEGLAHLRCR